MRYVIRGTNLKFQGAVRPDGAIVEYDGPLTGNLIKYLFPLEEQIESPIQEEPVVVPPEVPPVTETKVDVVEEPKPVTVEAPKKGKRNWKSRK